MESISLQFPLFQLSYVVSGNKTSVADDDDDNGDGRSEWIDLYIIHLI